MLQCIQYVALEQFLIRDSDLDWHVSWTMLAVPVHIQQAVSETHIHDSLTATLR